MPATVAAAEVQLPSLFDRTIANGVTKAIPKRLQTGAGLFDLVRRAINKSQERHVPRVPRTKRVSNTTM